MKIKVFKICGFDELEKQLKREAREKRKDEERGRKQAELRYDCFIDLIINLAICVSECGEFARDSELFRKHLHEAPLQLKQSFFRNFSSMSDEIVNDLMELTAEYAAYHRIEKKMGSNDKEVNKKVKESIQTKN